MESYYLYALFLPIIGYLWGSVKNFRIITNKHSCILFLTIALLIILEAITGISCSFDPIDDFAISIGLCAFGYSATRWKDPSSDLSRPIILTFRISLFLFYASLPILAYFALMMAFGNDRIGQIVQTENHQNYKIKHLRINSNFTYPGNHYATVYQKFLLLEFPIRKYDLGTYGAFGFGSFTVVGDQLIQSNKFRYSNDTLLLYNYENGTYKLSRKFYPNSNED